MAAPTQVIRHNFDGRNSAQLIGFRDQLVTNAQMAALAATLGPQNKGVNVFNIEQNQPFFWSGAVFRPVAADIKSGLIAKGSVDATQPLAAQVEDVSGYQYLVNVAGVLPATLTFGTGAGARTVSVFGDTNQDGVIEVERGDMLVFFDTAGNGADVDGTQSTRPDTLHVYQRNVEQATEVGLGSVRLATQAEVNAGTVMDEAITPATLRGFFAAQRVPRQFSGTFDVTTAAAVAEDGFEAIVTHNLGLADKRDFVSQTVSGDFVDSLAIEVIDANSLKLKALDPTMGVRFTMVAAATTYAA